MPRKVICIFVFFVIWSCISKRKTEVIQYTSALETQAPGENPRLIMVGTSSSEGNSSEVRSKVVEETPGAGCLKGSTYRIYFSPSKKPFEQSMSWVEGNLELAKEGSC